MKKKLFTLFLALCMVLTLMPVSVLADTSGGDGQNKPTEIWVNGVNILTDEDKTLTCGDGTAVYEESSNTLTLNAAKITAREGREGAGIYATGDLNIVLSGNNLIDSTVVSEGSEVVSVGIKADGALHISGSGSLNIDTEFLAITSAGDMTISGGAITAASEERNVFWANGGTITISGGDITAVSSNNYPALWADTDMTITSGKVNATSTGSNGMGAGGSLSISGTANVTAEGPYPGLFATGDISISGGKVNATGTNDSGIFTNGALSISGTADVTATGGLYCGLQAVGAITISGGKVSAISSQDSAIYTPASIAVTGSPEIIARGALRALQTVDLDISGGIIDAESANESAITATEKLSITGNAQVIARGKVCALLAEDEMILSAKNIKAYSDTNYAVSNVGTGKDIAIGGKLTAESEKVYAIRSYGDIITDSNADISATGGWGGIQADGDITITGSKIEAVGKDDDGIYSTGVISIDGGSVRAKGGSGYAAIRAKSVQAADEAAEAKILLSGNLVEKNGGKIAFIDWFVNEKESKSFTTFIGKNDTVLETSMSNALNEVWLSAPVPVTPVTPLPSPEEDVVNDPSDKTTTADTKPTVTDGKAEVRVDQSLADKIIGKAAANGSKEIVIDAVTSKGDTTGAEIQLPSKIMEDIVKKTEADLTIKTDAGTLTFDQKAAEAIAASVTGENITISADLTEKEGQIYLELKVVDGEKTIGSFGGGKVTVTVRLSEELKDKDVVCVYIDEDGRYHRMEGKKNDDGTFTFTTGHFSTFAIMTAEEAEKVIAEQTAARIKAGVKATTIKASSTAGKGWIRIKWKRSKGFKVDYYQVFRSTKKNSGYGTKPFYTTKTGTQTTYKNTKAVKKGTRYYYKVRGVRILDGKNVYTKWSNKAYRIAR